MAKRTRPPTTTRRPFLPPNPIRLAVAVLAKRPDITFTVGIGVVLAILFDAAKFRAIAVIEVVEASPRSGIEKLASPHLLPRDQSTVTKPDFVRLMHATPKSFI